ncbi:isotocin-neurophysin IT 1 [Pundamilia nyererei]|uniref:Isotocin-neurophysin IT 1 n=1 Tax=Pundamilia nyererei TaxID=303518 RepID=A0A9Y6JEN7_9CICH|nr:PREDICTED: oxytocin-neurophysin 1 [Pundamilia nyererei]
MTGAAVSVCLLFLLSVCSACYISNCPIGGKRSIMDAPLRKSCTTDQSCLIEEEGDEQTSQFDGSDPGDIILRLLHLAGHSSPHRVHQ